MLRAMPFGTMHDLILIHPPSVFDFREHALFRGPIAEVIPSSEQFEMYPIGITSIAAYLAKNGYAVRIVNLARRMVAEPSFDAVRHLAALRSRVFGIDLHWLPHAQGALAVARLVKRLHPDARVLMGGLSASYYRDELMREPAVDFVLSGDSTEEPSRQLLRALRERRPLEDVATLTWRRDDGAVVDRPGDRPAATGRVPPSPWSGTARRPPRRVGTPPRAPTGRPP